MSRWMLLLVLRGTIDLPVNSMTTAQFRILKGVRLVC